MGWRSGAWPARTPHIGPRVQPPNPCIVTGPFRAARLYRFHWRTVKVSREQVAPAAAAGPHQPGLGEQGRRGRHSHPRGGNRRVRCRRSAPPRVRAVRSPVLPPVSPHLFLSLIAVQLSGGTARAGANDVLTTADSLHHQARAGGSVKGGGGQVCRVRIRFWAWRADHSPGLAAVQHRVGCLRTAPAGPIHRVAHRPRPSHPRGAPPERLYSEHSHRLAFEYPRVPVCDVQPARNDCRIGTQGAGAVVRRAGGPVSG